MRGREAPQQGEQVKLGRRGAADKAWAGQGSAGKELNHVTGEG